MHKYWGTKHSPEEVGNQEKAGVGEGGAKGDWTKTGNGSIDILGPGSQKVRSYKCPWYLYSLQWWTEVASGCSSSFCALCGCHHPIQLLPFAHYSMPYTTENMEHWGCLLSESQKNEYLSWKPDSPRNTVWLWYLPQPLNTSFDVEIISWIM